MYRPEGWSNPYHDDGLIPLVIDVASTQVLMHRAYEAGADAMFKAILEDGSYMTPEQMKLLAPDRKYPYGWLVFIPELKEDNDE